MKCILQLGIRKFIKDMPSSDMVTADKVREGIKPNKSVTCLDDLKMRSTKFARCRGILPSILLLAIVALYLYGYITFRMKLNTGDPVPLISELNEIVHGSDERFYIDWIHENEARLDWSNRLAPCRDKMAWSPVKEWWHRPERTDPQKSYISLWEINSAGEYSRIFIQSQTPKNNAKTIGGDSWRVKIRGPASLNSLIRDFANGTYEVKFLPVESGKYELSIFLEYTLCDGTKDPPPDWFIKGSAQGKDQQHGILGNDIPYINRPLWNGIPIIVTITESKRSKQENNRRWEKACNLAKAIPCNMLLNGLGRWINKTWYSFCKDKPIFHRPRKRKGIFWIFGDSTSTRLHWFIHGKPLCHQIFKQCSYSYNWIYQIDNYNLTLNKFIKRQPNRTFLFQKDELDFNIDRIFTELKQVLLYSKMDENSVLLVNYGLHFSEVVNFTSYRKLIDGLIDLIEDKNSHRCTVIWRSTSALNRFKYSVPYLHSRRFLTPQRVELFNSYANWAMCKAGIPMLDIFPLTNSYPNGTGNEKFPHDPVHYDYEVMDPVEKILVKMYGE